MAVPRPPAMMMRYRDIDMEKGSVEKAVALLQTIGAQFTRTSGGYSCHHQSGRPWSRCKASGLAVTAPEYRRGIAFVPEPLSETVQ
jgi:hypothetical protein